MTDMTEAEAQALRDSRAERYKKHGALIASIATNLWIQAMAPSVQRFSGEVGLKKAMDASGNAMVMAEAHVQTMEAILNEVGASSPLTIMNLAEMEKLQ